MTTKKHHLLLLILVALIGVSERLYLSTLGENYDMESWWIVSNLILSDQSIFASTHRYNYGPVWAGIIGCARWLSAHTGADTISRFHLFITLFLACFDIGIGLTLAKRYGPAAFACILLSPVNVLISGYHSQMDGIAVFFALLFWERFTLHGRRTINKLLCSGLLALSLMSKHMLIPFLPWLLLAERPVRKHLFANLYIVLAALTLFAMSFSPWLFDAASIEGTRANVILYRSTEGESLIGSARTLLAKDLGLSALQAVPLRTVFLSLLVASGCLVTLTTRLWQRDLFLFFLLLVALSSGTQDQYLAIPMSAVAISLGSAIAWLYTLLATATILVGDQNIGALLGIASSATMHSLLFVASQACCLALFLRILRRN